MAKALFDPQQTGDANLLDVCPIVPGAVVSKPLIQHDHAKLIVFAMDADQSISDHRAPFVAWVQVLDGEVTFTVNDKTHTLRAHDWLVMPPNVPHALTATAPTRFTLTLIKESAT